MPTLTMGSTARYTWLLDYTITQDVMTNESTIAYVLKIRRDTAAGNGSWWNGPNRTFTVTVDGTADAENTYAADFRVASPITFVTGSKVIAHNSDGTHSPVSVTTAVSGPAVSVNFPIPLSFTQSISLPTIPRAASSITRTSGTQTGSSTTLSLSPLVSSFYYVLKYKSPATGSWTTIGSSSGIAGSSWPYSTTIAHAQIPNAGSGTIQFQVTTLDSSGGTQIGSPAEASFTYTVPSGVMPTAAAPSLWEEGATTAGLSTITNSGAVFAQGWSKLKPTFASSPGTGASVVTDIVTVAGVSGNTTSGVAFANVVTSQGSGATFDVAVTDSRSRVDHETGTVSPAVHRWSLPVANAGSAVVTPTSTTQTIALSGLQAATTSFYLSGAQRNTLQTRVGYRDRTTAGAWSYGSWTTQTLSTSDGTDNAYAPGSSITVATGLDPSHEYEVTLQVRDAFGAASTNYSTGLPYVESSILVPAQNVLVSLDGNTRVGIKKIPTQGSVDISGEVYVDDQIYQNGTHPVIDTSTNVTGQVSAATTSAQGKVELATDAETQTGTDATRAITPANLSARTATTSRSGIAELATDAEAIAGSDTGRVLTPSNLKAVITRSVGLVKVIPSSVGSGASVDADGEITFTNCASLQLNGVFSSAYRRYRIVIEIESLTANGTLYLRMRNSGSDNTSSVYRYTRDYGFGSSPAAPSNTNVSQIEIPGGTSSYHAADIEVFSPAQGQNTGLTALATSLLSSGSMAPSQLAGMFVGSNTFDGISIYSNNGNMYGHAAVYALA